jgi:hypothetical protein
MTTIEEQLKNYVEEQFEKISGCCSRRRELVEYDLPVLIINDMKYVVSCRFYVIPHPQQSTTRISVSTLIRIFKSEDYKFQFPTILKQHQTVERIDIETITSLLNQTREMMNNLKYDKLYNKIVVDDEVYAKIKLDSIMVEFMTDSSSKIKPDCDECCVCKEVTYAKTQCCKGTLCLPCLLQIREVENDGHTSIPCPLCREDMMDYEG